MSEQIKLPEGATVLDLPPFEPSVELALEFARLGASDEAIRALGGDEALELVREARLSEADPGTGNGHSNGHAA